MPSIVYLIISLVIAACAPATKLAPPAGPNTDYGNLGNYKRAIIESCENELDNPEQAQFKFHEPKKAQLVGSMFENFKIVFTGWVVEIDINDGYTGFERSTFLVHDSKVYHRFSGSVSRYKSILRVQ